LTAAAFTAGVDGAMRIASLLPSATEIVGALGAEDQMVGRSHECDFPESIRDRPVLTASKIDPAQSSRAIDQSVRAALTDALSVYEVNENELARTRPDVVLTQDLCEVCAVSQDEVRRTLERSVGGPTRLVSLSPTRLSNVLDDVERVADALGIAARGRRVRAELEARITAIDDRAAKAASRPRVVSIEWLEPIMLGGTWMPELIETAGGKAVGVHAGHAAPTVTPDALRALVPEVVIVKPCGFTLARALEERDVIERTIQSAVGAGTRIYVTDGNAFFNRPGPRLVESLEIAAACIHPELFEDFGARHANALVRLPGLRPSPPRMDSVGPESAD